MFVFLFILKYEIFLKYCIMDIINNYYELIINNINDMCIMLNWGIIIINMIKMFSNRSIFIYWILVLKRGN